MGRSEGKGHTLKKHLLMNINRKAHVLANNIPRLSVLSVYIILPKAPEILEGQGVGPETDVWAIGVLSFIM